MNKKLDKLVAELMKEIPAELIPQAYVRNIVEENLDCFDTISEVMSETKMQLSEESGLEFMLTRQEAEDYLCDAIPDARWEGVSRENRVSSRLVKAMEEDEDSTLFELLKSMPLIPAAKLISSIVMKHLNEHGVELEGKEIENLCMDVIGELDTTLYELQEGPDDDDGDEDDDLDIFDRMGIEFETDEDELPQDMGRPVQDDMKISRGRRSRITRFPGKK